MFNVLLLDDSSMDLILLKEITELSLPFKKHINVFNNAQNAIESWRKQDYQLIITDIEMPDIDGYDFIEAIKSEKKQTIIAVSGSVADDNANETILYAATAFGANYTVSKANLFDNLTGLLTKLYGTGALVN